MLPWIWWFLIMMILFIIPAKAVGDRTRRMISRRAAKRQREKGEVKMSELINGFIGKECIIWTNGYSSAAVEGTITRTQENWVEIEDKNGNKQIINADYISRIQEYPRKSNGKKKAVFM